MRRLGILGGWNLDSVRQRRCLKKPVSGVHGHKCLWSSLPFLLPSLSFALYLLRTEDSDRTQKTNLVSSANLASSFIFRLLSETKGETSPWDFSDLFHPDSGLLSSLPGIFNLLIFPMLTFLPRSCFSWTCFSLFSFSCTFSGSLYPALFSYFPLSALTLFFLPSCVSSPFSQYNLCYMPGLHGPQNACWNYFKWVGGKEEGIKSQYWKLAICFNHRKMSPASLNIETLMRTRFSLAVQIPLCLSLAERLPCLILL